MATARSKADRAEAPSVIRIEPLAVDRNLAAGLLCLGTSTFERLVQQGKLPKPRQIGGNARWRVDELRTAVELLPESDMLPPPRAGQGA